MTSIAPKWTRRVSTTTAAEPTTGLGPAGWIGAAGAVVISASSWWVGSVPHAWQTHPPAQLGWFAIGSIQPRIAFYVGLILLTAAWLSLGRNVLSSPRAEGARRMRRIALVWATPMMGAIPLASRDLWAYATQGRLIQRGFDPYSYAPIDMPGVFSQNVSPGWVHSPAPYGPFWLAVNHAVAATYGEHVLIAVFLLRIPVLAGLLVLLWAVPRLAERAGIPADRALWLTAANPFTIELVLGAGHNDLLMAGLMTAGAALALRPGPAVAVTIPAAAVMALAAGVKSPGFIGLAFVVPLVLSRNDDVTRRSLRTVVTVTAAALVSGLVTFAVVSVATGFGLGWVHQVGASAPLVNWLSVPTDTAIFADIITGHVDGATHLDDPMRHWRTAGLILSAVLIAAIWIGAVLAATGRKRLPRPTASRPTANRPEPNRPAASRPATSQAGTAVTMLGTAMLTLTLLGPAVQLWYLLWALPFLTRAGDHRRAIFALATIETAMVFTVDPHGLSFTMKPVVTAIIAVSAVVVWLTLRHSFVSASPSADHDPDRARAGVHADGRSHFQGD